MCNKLKYSELGAKIELANIGMCDTTLKPIRRPIRYYYCRDCGYYHLSSQVNGEYNTRKGVEDLFN